MKGLNVMKNQLEQIRQLALEAINSADALQDIETLRVKYLGKKGELTGILKQMGKLSAEERPVIGQLANEIRGAIEQAIEQKVAQLKSAEQAKKLLEENIKVPVVMFDERLTSVISNQVLIEADLSRKKRKKKMV